MLLQLPSIFAQLFTFLAHKGFLFTGALFHMSSQPKLCEIFVTMRTLFSICSIFYANVYVLPDGMLTWKYIAAEWAICLLMFVLHMLF
jgi:hypothetical protein